MVSHQWGKGGTAGKLLVPGVEEEGEWGTHEASWSVGGGWGGLTSLLMGSGSETDGL